MNKRVKGIIGLGIVLAALGGGLAALKLTEPEKEESSVEASSEASGSGISLIKKDSDTIKQIEVSNSTGSYTVVRTAEAKDGNSAEFGIKGYENVPIDETMLSTLAANISDLTSLSIVSDASDELEKYGLADPECTVDFYFDSGDSIKIYIGDISPVSSSTYFMMGGDDAVYTVSTSKMSNYRQAVGDFVSKTIMKSHSEEDAVTVKSLRIKREDLDYDIYVEYDERTEDENYKGGTASTHIMLEPIKCYLGYEKTDKAITGLFGLTASDIYSINCTDVDIASAGLNNPFATVEMSCDDGNNYKFYMSEPFTDDDGVKCHYFMFDGGNMIYTVKAEDAVWATMMPIDITSRTVYGSTVWDIRELTVGGKGLDKVEFKGDGTSAEDYTVTMDGKSMDTERFRLFYKFLLSTDAEDLAIGKTIPEGAEPAVTVTVLDKDMSEPMTVEYYEDESYKSLIAVNGECRYIGTNAYIETLIGNIKKLATGEEFVTTWKR